MAPLWYDMVHNSAENIDWLQGNGVQFNGVVDNYGARSLQHHALVRQRLCRNELYRADAATAEAKRRGFQLQHRSNKS